MRSGSRPGAPLGAGAGEEDGDDSGELARARASGDDLDHERRRLRGVGHAPAGG